MTPTPKQYRHRRRTRLSYDDRIASPQSLAPSTDRDSPEGEIFALMHDDAPRDNSSELRAMRAAVLTALGRLTDRQRAAVELHYLNGLSQREIAALWGVTPSAVCHLLERARARLRSLIVV